MKIYIVQGSTGEYSDRTDWIVCAYTDWDNATDHALKAEQWAVAWHNEHESDYYEKQEEAKNPYDPLFQCDYTGTSYWVKECELIDG